MKREIKFSKRFPFLDISTEYFKLSSRGFVIGSEFTRFFNCSLLKKANNGWMFRVFFNPYSFIGKRKSGWVYKKDSNKNNINIITIKADIHPDGDVYIKNKKGEMEHIGCLKESEMANLTEFPHRLYKKAKKITNK